MRFLFTLLRSILYLCLFFAVGIVFTVFHYSILGAQQPWSLIPYIISTKGSALLGIAACITFFFTILSVLNAPFKKTFSKILNGVFCFLFFGAALWASFLMQDLSPNVIDIFHSLYATEAKEEYRALNGEGFWFEQRVSADQVENIVLVNPERIPVVENASRGQFVIEGDLVESAAGSVSWKKIDTLAFPTGSTDMVQNFFADSADSFALLSDFFHANDILLRMLLVAQMSIVFFALSLFLFFVTHSFALHIGFFLIMFRLIVWGFPRWMSFGISLYPNDLILQLVFTGSVLLLATCITFLFKRKHNA